MNDVVKPSGAVVQSDWSHSTEDQWWSHAPAWCEAITSNTWWVFYSLWQSAESTRHSTFLH